MKMLVCGMDVDPRAPDTLSVQLGGNAYYFCSEKCKKDFETSPGKYVHEMAAQDGIGAKVAK